MSNHETLGHIALDLYLSGCHTSGEVIDIDIDIDDADLERGTTGPRVRSMQPGGHGAPAQLGVDVLAELVHEAPEGIAVADSASPDYLYVNRSGSEIVESLRDEGASAGSVFPPLSAEASPPNILGHGNRQYEHSTTSLSAGGLGLRATRFRDVTRAYQRERHLAVFSRTSASIAFAGPLHTVLDRLAEEVRDATGILSCTFLLMDEGGRLRQAGVAAQDYPGVSDYAERLERCRALGAPLLSVQAFQDRRPIVMVGWRERTLADPRFQPIHGIAGAANWSTLATIPVVGRGEILGVLNGFYLPGDEPDEEDLSFLTTIADLAAVAIENSRLVKALEAKAALEERHLLARELHDSVNQALFSLTLQTRALEIGMASERLTTAAILGGLADVRELTEGALAEMRALIFQLRPAALHEEGLVSAVRKHASAIEAREGLTLAVEGLDAEVMLAPAVEEQLFRVVQEALHNIVKHAGARSAHISLRVDEDRADALELVISDDGSGFDTGSQHPGHLGLCTMAERVAEIGGEFSLTSMSSGTTIRAWIPEVVSPSPHPERRRG